LTIALEAFALARRGAEAAIHIGAARDDGVGAHAWVTIGGRPIVPAEARRYAVLWRCTASRSQAA